MSTIHKCPECSGNELCSNEIRGLYDGTAYWSCLKCGARWHRFEEGHPYRSAVELVWATEDVMKDRDETHRPHTPD